MRVLETTVPNPYNSWFGTNAGNDTTDRIFLLSFNEVLIYLAGTKQGYAWTDGGDWNDGRINGESDDEFVVFIYDERNDDRIAKYANEKAWWWLRSPGRFENFVGNVGVSGEINVEGGFASVAGGIRPALWLRLTPQEETQTSNALSKTALMSRNS